MNKLHYIIFVPVIAITLGFQSPEIDLHRNVREAHNTKVIKQKQGTSKSDKLESFRTRRSFRNRDSGNKLRDKLREKLNQRSGDQRSVAQFYVNSWFIASFSLDLDDNTLLRVKDIYAKAISEVGLITKGNSRRSREKRKVMGKIHSTFDRELKKTIDAKQYKKLMGMTTENGKDFYRHEKKVDKES
tara:strand:+ start:425 stop:985 length:561 start_codon:yes stop_codon:yes gene_type:complete